MVDFKPLTYPYHVYLAAAGTAKPAVNQNPPTAWNRIGTAALAPGAVIGADGVEFMHDDTVEKQPVGVNKTRSRKAYLTEEMDSVKFSLYDFEITLLNRLMRGQKALTTTARTATTPEIKTMPLAREVLPHHALLIRASSQPEQDDNTKTRARQIWMPRVFRSNNINFSGTKTYPQIEVTFEGLEDDTLGAGVWDWITQDATSGLLIATRSANSTFTAADFTGGVLSGPTYMLPTFTADSYVAFAVPTAAADLTWISLAGGPNVISAFTKVSSALTIGGVSHEVWDSDAKLESDLLSASEWFVY